VQGSNAMTRRDVAEAGHRFRGFDRSGLAIGMATRPVSPRGCHALAADRNRVVVLG